MTDEELLALAVAEAQVGLSEGGIPIGAALAQGVRTITLHDFMNYMGYKPRRRVWRPGDERPYSLTAAVERGAGRGRTIGIPTLNLAVPDRRKLLPPEGMYAVRVQTPGGPFGGMMNLGPRPTFGDLAGATGTAGLAILLIGIVPLVLKRLSVDPAIASGPLLTTVTDMCGFFFVMGIATLLLPLLV